MVQPENNHHVEIKQEDNLTRVYVDGKEIQGINKVIFKQDTCSIPTFTIGVLGNPNIDLNGKVIWEYTPSTIEEAERLVKEEIWRNPVYRRAKLDEIEDLLRESTVVWEEWEYKMLAERIVDRLYGERRTY